MRNSEKLRAFRESPIVSSPRLTYSAIADNPEGGQSGKEIGGSGGSNGKGGSDGRSIVFISQELHEFARNKDCKKLFALHYLTNFYLMVNYFVNRL